MKIHAFADDAKLSAAVAEAVIETVAGPYKDPTAIMLAGGSTPLAAYSIVAQARRRIDPKLTVFFSDDRHVPPWDEKSNFGNIVPHLHRCGILDNYVLRVHGELPLEAAVNDYEKQLDGFFKRNGKIALGLLGLGTDGHTASLFNADDIKRGTNALAVGVQRPDGLQGISVTPSVLARVERLLIVISGAGKKAMAQTLINSPGSIAAGLAVKGHPNVELWTDEAAKP